RGFGSPTMPRGAPRAAQRAGGNATQRILQESPHIVTERLPIVGAPALWQATGGHMRQLCKRSITKAIVVAALAAGVSGCDRGSSDSEENAHARPLLAAFNAVPDVRSITFLREEEEWDALTYGQGTAFRGVDADRYALNFDTILPG